MKLQNSVSKESPSFQHEPQIQGFPWVSKAPPFVLIVTVILALICDDMHGLHPMRIFILALITSNDRGKDCEDFTNTFQLQQF